MYACSRQRWKICSRKIIGRGFGWVHIVCVLIKLHKISEIAIDHSPQKNRQITPLSLHDQTNNHLEADKSHN